MMVRVNTIKAAPMMKIRTTASPKTNISYWNFSFHVWILLDVVAFSVSGPVSN